LEEGEEKKEGTDNHDAKPQSESYENIIHVCLCSSVAKKLIFIAGAKCAAMTVMLLTTTFL